MARKRQPKKQATRRLRMELEHVNDAISVTWSIPGRAAKGEAPKPGEPGYRWDYYEVSFETLEGLNDRIAKHLSALQDVDWKVGALKESASAYKPILAQLIQAGQALQNTVLSGIDGNKKWRQRANAFRTWFEENVEEAPPGSWRIEVVHSSFDKAITPWALAATSMPKEDIDALDPTDPDQYDVFWGARFKLAVRAGVEIDAGEEEVRDGDGLSVACVVELDEYGHTQLIKSMAQRDLLSMKKNVRWDRDGFKALAQDHSRNDLFWYISLRCDGGSFRLGNDKFGSSDLEETKPGSNEDRITLMMLDGDAVIRRHRGEEWVAQAFNIGRSGLIAVEADIKNERLHQYGWNILYDILLSQKPLLDAIIEARRKHWPLGLLYGLYCSPVNAVIKPPPEKLINGVANWLKAVTGASTKEGRP